MLGLVDFINDCQEATVEQARARNGHGLIMQLLQLMREKL